MGGWELVKMLASLVLVFALMGLLLWALRRMQIKLQTPANGQRQLQLIETFGVGPRQKILLMQVDGQRILVGVTAQQMQPLGQWAAPAGAKPQESTPHA